MSCHSCWARTRTPEKDSLGPGRCPRRPVRAGGVVEGGAQPGAQIAQDRGVRIGRDEQHGPGDDGSHRQQPHLLVRDEPVQLAEQARGRGPGSPWSPRLHRRCRGRSVRPVPGGRSPPSPGSPLPSRSRQTSSESQVLAGPGTGGPGRDPCRRPAAGRRSIRQRFGLSLPRLVRRRVVRRPGRGGQVRERHDPLTAPGPAPSQPSRCGAGKRRWSHAVGSGRHPCGARHGLGRRRTGRGGDEGGGFAEEDGGPGRGSRSSLEHRSPDVPRPGTVG